MTTKTKNIVYWTTTILIAFFIGGGGVAQMVFLRGNCRHRASLATRYTFFAFWAFGRYLGPLPYSCRVFRGSRNGPMPASSLT